MESSPNVADAALAVAQVAYDTARLPLGIAARLPGMRRLANDGAYVRVRLRSRLESVVLELLSAPELERAVDRVIAGTLPDAIVRSLLEHHVVERLAEEVDLDAAVAAVIASPQMDRLLVQATDRALQGPELQRVIEHVAASPEVRMALTKQSTTMAEELTQGVRARAETLDDVAERTVRGWLRRPHPAALAPAGIATRGTALAIDAAIANLICLVLGALIGLVTSLVGDLRPQWVVALLAAAGWALIVGGYFTLFWATTGQTPGMRLMRLQVVTYSGGRVHFVRALIRLGGLVLAIIPLFAGFVPVLFDARRRGLHDWLARTLVIHVTPSG